MSIFCSAKQFAELFAAAIFSEQANDTDAIDKFAEIPGDVGRAAGIKRFARDFDHRHGRLRRDAADFAPDEFVEHEVADDEKALARSAL